MQRKTIRNHKDFLTERGALRVSDDCFSIIVKEAKIPADARFGLVTPKKVFKLAVDRNRAKRVIRDWIAFNEKLMLNNLDYIFILREPILHLGRDQGRKKMQLKLKRLEKIYSADVSK